jgi:hypothetical protein
VRTRLASAVSRSPASIRVFAQAEEGGGNPGGARPDYRSPHEAHARVEGARKASVAPSSEVGQRAGGTRGEPIKPSRYVPSRTDLVAQAAVPRSASDGAVRCRTVKVGIGCP